MYALLPQRLLRLLTHYSCQNCGACAACSGCPICQRRQPLGAEGQARIMSILLLLSPLIYSKPSKLKCIQRLPCIPTRSASWRTDASCVCHMSCHYLRQSLCCFALLLCVSGCAAGENEMEYRSEVSRVSLRA